MIKNSLELYERSADFLWTDEHICKEMLKVHLMPQNDWASRKAESIEKTISWFSDSIDKGSKILDLGCGPGLYTRRLAQLGYEVTGIDISTNSIEYAKLRALEENQSISYKCMNYLTDDWGGTYEAIICIYCDFGALTPTEQNVFLRKVKSALTPNGIFVMDVFSPSYSKTRIEGREWYTSDGNDFWSKKPYLMLEEVVHFKSEHTWGTRNTLIRENCQPKTFITWDTYYDEIQIAHLLKSAGLECFEIKNDLIQQTDMPEEAVLFIKSRLMK